MKPDEVIAGLAANQFGVVTRRQALVSGLSRRAIEGRIKSRRWERTPHLGVYFLAGTPKTWEHRLMAATLSIDGAVASHRAAAALLRFPGFRPGIIELTAPRGRKSPRRGALIHESRDLPPGHITKKQGIPLTTPERTLIDLFQVVRAELVEEALDDALRRGLVSLARIQTKLDSGPQNGSVGVALLRRLIDARANSQGLESVLETRFLRAIRTAGLPIPVRQFRVLDDDGLFVARVDFAYPELRIAIEVDGRQFHSNKIAFESDRSKGNELLRLNWRVLHFTDSDLRDGGRRAVQSLSKLLAETGHRSGGQLGARS